MVTCEAVSRLKSVFMHHRKHVPNNRRAKGETYMPYTSADEQRLMKVKEAGEKLG